MQTDYCRDIEAYLCRKNDGHLIRVVGPSFDLVSRWAADGVPLKVAYGGIDRYFERYYKKGPRRRPVRIDFCEADVLDLFDEWRRAVGLVAPAGERIGPDDEVAAAPARKGASLPAHLERVVLRLTNARALGRSGAWGARGDDLDDLIDRVSRELDTAGASAGGVRGDARRALLDRLTSLDAEIGALALAALDPEERGAFERDADDELAGFRDRLTPDAYGRARAAVLDRLARARFSLPTVSLA